MKPVTKIQTFDGKLHDNQKAALKHIQARYADILLPICAKLTQMKYTEIAQFIDDNLDLFSKLITIKQDEQRTDNDE